MSYTPTPWTVNKEWWDSLPADSDDTETDDLEVCEDGDIRGPQGQIIADVYLQSGDDHYKSDIASANAAHIVKCVNSHDALVEALRGVLHHNNAIKSQYQLPQSLISQIEQALSKGV